MPTPAYRPCVAAATEAWSNQLASWALPDSVLARAPESPWSFDVGVFEAQARRALDVATVSQRLAAESLPANGDVLDVGAGVGAGSLPLAPRARLLTAVDASPSMLARFAALAAELGVDHREIAGSWPAAAVEAPVADVVVCHHVFYNVADLAPFVSALTRHARRAVVCEMTAVHPQSALSGLWLRFHGLRRPTGPTAEDLVAALGECGLEPEVHRWESPRRWSDHDRATAVASVRRRLCLPPERDPEIDDALGDPPVLAPTRLVTLRWAGAAG